MNNIQPAPPDAGRVHSPEDAYRESHGLSQSVVKSEVQSSQDGVVIISTVLMLTAHSLAGGFGVLFETRIFGGRYGGFAFALRSTESPSRAILQAVEQHVATTKRLVESYVYGLPSLNLDEK